MVIGDLFKKDERFKFNDNGTIETLDGGTDYKIMFLLKFVKKTGLGILRLNIGLTPYIVRDISKGEYFKLELSDNYNNDNFEGKVISIGADMLSVFNKCNNEEGVYLHISKDVNGLNGCYVSIFTWLERTHGVSKRMLAMETFIDLKNDILNTFYYEPINDRNEMFILTKRKSNKRCEYSNIIIALNFAKKVATEFEVI